MQMIKLKITIPTFNRPDHIKRQVRDLLPQLRDGVELIVYDNCSETPVSTLFSKEELAQFSLIRNKFNIGGAANIGKCLADNGDSGWIWLLGDDDEISSDAVETILKTIGNNRECCYINFHQKREQKTTSFLDFLNYLKILGAFGISFFQSACIFNMDKLRPYVRFYYDYISSWVGQIVMIIKYLEENPDEKCLFTSVKIIKNVNEGGWSHLDLIVNSLMLTDRFYYLKAVMKGTLFKALGDMNFTMLAQADTTYKSKRYYRKYIISRLGMLNVLKYNRVSLAQYVLSILMPSKIFDKIRTKAAQRYRKKIKKS